MARQAAGMGGFDLDLVTIAMADAGIYLSCPVLDLAAGEWARSGPKAARRRLGSGQDSAERQSALARAIYRDHRFSLARTIVVLGLQLMAR